MGRRWYIQKCWLLVESSRDRHVPDSEGSRAARGPAPSGTLRSGLRRTSGSYLTAQFGPLSHFLTWPTYFIPVSFSLFDFLSKTLQSFSPIWDCISAEGDLTAHLPWRTSELAFHLRNTFVGRSEQVFPPWACSLTPEGDILLVTSWLG